MAQASVWQAVSFSPLSITPKGLNHRLLLHIRILSHASALSLTRELLTGRSHGFAFLHKLKAARLSALPAARPHYTVELLLTDT